MSRRPPYVGILAFFMAGQRSYALSDTDTFFGTSKLSSWKTKDKCLVHSSRHVLRYCQSSSGLPNESDPNLADVSKTIDKVGGAVDMFGGHFFVHIHYHMALLDQMPINNSQDLTPNYRSLATLRK